MAYTKVSDEIEIQTDKANNLKTIIAKKRHSSGLDRFAVFFFFAGIVCYSIASFSVDKDFTFFMASFIFLILFGGLGIQIYIAYRETQIVEIHNDHLIFYKKRPFFSKSFKLDKKDKKKIQLVRLGVLDTSHFNIFIGVKHITSLYSYEIPIINGFTFFEHFDENQKKWIINYLNKK